MILDLDPPSAGTAQARRAATVMRALLEEVGLAAGLMATGSRGYHLVVPIEPTMDISEVERASRLLAGLAAARHPGELTSEFLIEQRRGRVFVDWLRNRPAQSTVCPWSLRARPVAPVATPIAWDELEATDPDRWTLPTIADRIGLPDPWPATQDLRASVEVIERLAGEAGVSADEPFDRFGRRRKSQE